MKRRASNLAGVDAAMGEVIWLIRLRWLAVVGVLVTVLVVDRFFRVELVPAAQTLILTVTGLIALYNFMLYRRLPRVRRWLQSDPHRAFTTIKRLIHIQIVADLACLAVILDLSGGLLNPLCVFMLFHIAIAGITLSRVEAFAVASFASLLLVLLGLVGALWPALRLPLRGYPLETAAEGLVGNGFFIVSVVLSLAVTFYLIAYFTSSVSRDLRHVLEELETANEALRQQDREKSKFLRVIAHQLRSPLSAIISLAHAYAEPADSQQCLVKMPELVNRIDRRCRGLMALVDDLLRLTHIREGLDRHEQPAPIELNRAIADVCRMFEAQAAEKGLALQLDLPDGQPTVLAHPRDIPDIVENLVSNAIKYTDAGEVRVEGRVRSGRYVLAVRDSGIGIPEEDQKDLFREFFRAGNAKKREVNGSGLGLSIVQAVARRLGGDVRFESEAGRGATFIVELPLSQPIQMTIAAAQEAAKTS